MAIAIPGKIRKWLDSLDRIYIYNFMCPVCGFKWDVTIYGEAIGSTSSTANSNDCCYCSFTDMNGVYHPQPGVIIGRIIMDGNGVIIWSGGGSGGFPTW